MITKIESEKPKLHNCRLYSSKKKDRKWKIITESEY